MAKYFIEDTSIKDIADAIRGELGSTGTLTLHQMPGHIRSIRKYFPSLPSGITALASGTFTPASDVTTKYPIQHGLGITPNFFVIAAVGQELLKPADFSYYITHEYGLAQSFMMNANELDAFRIYRYSNGTTFTQTAAVGILNTFADRTSFYPYASATYSLKAGVTYRWVAGVLEGI
jgi:hypothetical protein